VIAADDKNIRKDDSKNNAREKTCHKRAQTLACVRITLGKESVSRKQRAEVGMAKNSVKSGWKKTGHPATEERFYRECVSGAAACLQSKGNKELEQVLEKSGRESMRIIVLLSLLKNQGEKNSHPHHKKRGQIVFRLNRGRNGASSLIGRGKKGS